jgi:nucleoid-associated protein YgaU
MSKDDREERTTEEKPGGSPRLGREAKIGVAVLLVLLIVFGTVVTRRLMGEAPDEVASTAVEKEKEREKDKLFGEAQNELFGREHKSRLFGGAGQATVVPAKAASTKPPRTSPGDHDRWKLPADKPDAKRTGDNGPARSSPSFMPEPPKPPAADPYERYASDPPAVRNLGRPAHEEESANDLRLVSPDEPARRRHPEPRYGQADAGDVGSGYALAAPAPSPSRVSPVGQYGDNDVRRGPIGSPYGNNELRRGGTGFAHASPPPRHDDGKYEVQPNDSYWTISERLYGTGAYFKALAEHNRGKASSENQLQPGELILAPPVTQLEQTYPDLCPKASRRETLQNRASTVSTRNQYRTGRTYTVAEGDTLFNIARYELGKASRWVEIYELNRDVLGKDFNYLTPGTQLSLPQDEKPDALTRQPGSTYRR